MYLFIISFVCGANSWLQTGRPSKGVVESVSAVTLTLQPLWLPWVHLQNNNSHLKVHDCYGPAITFIPLHLWPGPIGLCLWSNVIHYVGNWVPFWGADIVLGVKLPPVSCRSLYIKCCVSRYWTYWAPLFSVPGTNESSPWALMALPRTTPPRSKSQTRSGDSSLIPSRFLSLSHVTLSMWWVPLCDDCQHIFFLFSPKYPSGYGFVQHIPCHQVDEHLWTVIFTVMECDLLTRDMLVSLSHSLWCPVVAIRGHLWHHPGGKGPGHRVQPHIP